MKKIEQQVSSGMTPSLAGKGQKMDVIEFDSTPLSFTERK